MAEELGEPLTVTVGEAWAEAVLLFVVCAEAVSSDEGEDTSEMLLAPDLVVEGEPEVEPTLAEERALPL